MKLLAKSNPFLALLAVLIVIDSGCRGTTANPSEAAAVTAIQKLGGKVDFEGEGNDRRVIKVYLHNTKVQDADLSLIAKLPKLRNLFLGKTAIGDAGLQHLEQCADLQTLSLNSTAVTDAGLKSLLGLKSLKTINLQDTKVTVAGIAQLKKSLPGTSIAR